MLPPGTVPLIAQSGNPTLTLENGRPVVSLLINTSNGSVSGQWPVWFDVVSLRNLYYQEIYSIALLLGLLVLAGLELIFANLESVFRLALGFSSPSVPAIAVFIYNFFSFEAAYASSARQPFLICFGSFKRRSWPSSLP